MSECKGFSLKMRWQFYLAIILIFLSVKAWGIEMTCAVYVVDVQGNPVSNADVVVYEGVYNDLTQEYEPIYLCKGQRTNASGKTDLVISYVDSIQVMIVARKEGLSLGWDCLPQDNKANPDIYLILDCPAILSGIAADEKGRAVAGADIQALPVTSSLNRLEQMPVLGPVEWMQTKTDEKGGFQFDCFSADVNCAFQVKSSQHKTTYKFKPAPTSCGYEAGRDDIRLVLPDEIPVSGKVVDPSGKGIAGMTVLMDRDFRGKNSFYLCDYLPNSTKTDKNGNFVFEGVPAVSHFLKVLNTDISIPWVDRSIIVESPTSKDRKKLTVQLEKGGLTEILVLETETKLPISDVSVVVSQKPRDPNDWWFGRMVKTDKNGRAKMLAPEGECNLSLWKNGYSTTEQIEPIQISERKPYPKTFYLEPKPNVSGIVLDESGNPAKNIVVCAFWGDCVLTDDKGRFKTHFELRDKGNPLAAFDSSRNLACLTMVSDIQQQRVIKLGPAISLKGRIVNSHGLAIPAARILIQWRIPGAIDDFGSEILTDQQGRFEIKALPLPIDSVQYRISVTALNCGPYGETIDLPGQAGDSIELKPIQLVSADQNVNGVVINEDGTPASRITVLSNGNEQPHRTTVTDEQGHFVIRRLCAGKVSFQAGIGGEDFKPGRLECNGGDTDVIIVMGKSKTHDSQAKVIAINDKAMPGFEGITLPADFKRDDTKRLLICFWDINQRSSRHSFGELAKMRDALAQKGIQILTIQMAQNESDGVKEWAEKQVSLLMTGKLTGNIEDIRKKWGITALPWLIFVNAEGIVQKEGLGVEDLKSF